MTIDKARTIQESISEKELLKLYWDYVCIQLKLKHSFIVIDTESVGFKCGGYNTPDKLKGNIGFTYAWKHLKTLSFNEFKQNKEIVIEQIWKFS